MDVKTFSQRLKETREGQGMSLRELSSRTQKITGTGAPTASTICKYEKGDCNPVLSSVRALAEALGVATPWLMGADCDKYSITNSNINSTNCVINNGLSQEESALLEMFRALSVLDRAKVLIYIDGLKK